MNLFESSWNSADLAQIAEVLDRGTYWSDGPEVAKFGSEIGTLSGREIGLAFSSGTTALFALLMSMDIAGREVIVPSFTFPATVNSVVAAGGSPVFADIERDTFGLDTDHVASLINERTAAVVLVHFAGFVSVETLRIKGLADRHGIDLIEDNAHSIGATLQDQRAGSFGLAAITSHCFNKVIATGEGGCVVTDDVDLADSLRRYRNHGRAPGQGREYDAVGLNLRLSSISAAIGLAQLGRFDELVGERRRQANEYERALGVVDGIFLPVIPADQNPVWLLYNVLLESSAKRDALAYHLREAGVPTRVTYPPVHLYEVYRERFGGRKGQLPVTEDVSERILTIPLYPGLSSNDQRVVIEAIEKFSHTLAT